MRAMRAAVVALAALLPSVAALRLAPAMAERGTPPADATARQGRLVFGGQMALYAAYVCPLEEVGHLPAPPAAATLAGKALLLGGCILAAGGTVNLAAADALAPLPTPREGGELQRAGAYAVVRHPMYAGVVLGCVGVAMIAPSALRLGVLALLLANLGVKMGLEERALVDEYGADAEQYLEEVKWRVLPFVY